TKDLNTSLAVTFIGLLFIFFECLPVFVKLMSARGSYDHAIENAEKVQVHLSDKDRDMEITVADQIQETRVGIRAQQRLDDLRARE
ncbi:MAG: DUF4407 domain-containing protein, partial [Flavobacterium sp.]